MKLSQRAKLETAVYIAVAALAIPSIITAIFFSSSLFHDLLLNIGAGFLSVAFLFFLVNRFFGINEGGVSSERIETLIQLAERRINVLVDEDEARTRFPVKEYISSCEELDVVSFTLTDFLELFWSLIIERVKQGATVRVIVIDPYSTAHTVISENSPSHKPYDRSIVMTLSRIQQIQRLLDQEPRVKGHFEFKMTTWIPSCCLVIVNPKSKTKCGMMKVSIHSPHYSTPGRESNLNVILSQCEQPNWFKYFAQQFERLWAESHPWNQQIPQMPHLHKDTHE